MKFRKTFHIFGIMSPVKKTWIFLSITVVVFISYSSVLNNDFSLDDHYYYSQVENVKTWADISTAVKQKFSIVDYRPVTTFTFAIEQLISNEVPNPRIGHFINIILYILNCFQIFLLIEKFPVSEKKKYISILATLLFATLPVHTSMVANIKSRDGLLSFLWGMIYLNLFIRVLTKNESFFKKILWISLAVLSITAGVYSKLDAFNFLIITPLLFIIFNKSINLKILLRILFISAITFKVTIFLFEFWSESKLKAIEYSNSQESSDPVLFTENPIIAYENWSDKISFSIQTIFEYVKMVFSPSGHYYYFGYDMLPLLPLSHPIIWIKIAILTIIALSALFVFRKNTLYSFSVIFFFSSLIYCSNLITPVSGIIADRYVYIASLGACIAVAILLNFILTISIKKFSRFNLSLKKEPIYFIFPALLIMLIYLPYNYQRSKDWKSLFSIFEADLIKISSKSYEANRIAVKNYVETAIDTDDPQLREEYFKKGLTYGINATKIYDDGQYVQDGIIMSLYGLNDFNGAVAFSRKVIAKFDTTEIGWRILTEYYYNNKYLDSAAFGYRKLIDILPNDPNLYLFYVTTLQKNHETEKAFQYLDSLEKNNPNSYLPYQAKMYLYFEEKDSLKAVLNMEYAMEKGWRDNKMLDVAGQYWWSRDKEKWEFLKKYIQ